MYQLRFRRKGAEGDTHKQAKPAAKGRRCRIVWLRLLADHSDRVCSERALRQQSEEGSTR